MHNFLSVSPWATGKLVTLTGRLSIYMVFVLVTDYTLTKMSADELSIIAVTS